MLHTSCYNTSMALRLGDIAAIQSGYTFREKLHELPSGKVRVLQAKDVASYDFTRLPGITFDNPRHYLQNGDVLLSIRGNFTALPVETQGLHMVAAASVMIIRNIDSAVNPAYLALYLNSPDGQEQMRGLATGAAIKSITKARLSDLTIPVPTNEVQRKLVGLHGTIRKQQELLKRGRALSEVILHAATKQLTKITEGKT